MMVAHKLRTNEAGVDMCACVTVHAHHLVVLFRAPNEHGRKLPEWKHPEKRNETCRSACVDTNETTRKNRMEGTGVGQGQGRGCVGGWVGGRVGGGGRAETVVWVGLCWVRLGWAGLGRVWAGLGSGCGGGGGGWVGVGVGVGAGVGGVGANSVR